MFQNLKVLELASVLAGPSVGQFFAELGAEVNKVENLKAGGDVTRTWKGVGEQTDDRSAYFCSCNWGKKSIALDLTSEEGKKIVQKLAQRSDIIIASYKPGDAEKLGVAYQQLRTNNQQLIYGQITGYGNDNGRVGYDAVIQAETGFMDLNGEKEGPPTKMPVALIDVLAAHHLKEGLLLALLKREKSGEGSLVEVSLIQAALSSLANQATNWLVAKKLPTRQGSAHPNIAPYGDSFLTKDGKWILLAVGSDRQFEDLMKVLGIGTWGLGVGHQALDDKFLTNQQRVENRTALNDHLAESIAKFAAKELMKKINQLKIPAGLIQNVEEAFSTKEAREILMESENRLGVRNFVGHLSNFDRSNLLAPPHFGEHTSEILNSIKN
jgi:crotonobetainyl-CoA:carnitine CoA-transferase CaiB-like acyl-CoA transferase